MNIEAFREYCLSKKGTEETLPFGPDTLVFKVMGKMFALTGLDSDEFTVNLNGDVDGNGDPIIGEPPAEPVTITDTGTDTTGPATVGTDGQDDYRQQSYSAGIGGHL